MKGIVVALDRLQGREVAALIRDGRLDDLLADPLPDTAPDAAELAPGPGAIFRAVADRPMKGQGAMAMRLPDGGRAFLREAAGLKPGAVALVQVTGRAEEGKAVPVTARILLKGRFAIVTPEAPGINVSRRLKDDERRAALLALAAPAMEGSAMGLILRSEAETGEDEAILDDIAAMREVAERILAETGREPELLLDAPSAHQAAWRDWPAPDLLDAEPGSFARHGLAEMLDPLRRARVGLSGGAHAWIEPTRALVAVDVNSGADTTPAAGLKANLALARELPRQLRLRGLGGQVVLDLAPMPKKDRTTFEGTLRAAVRADPVETALVGWTPLGHFELQRKRERLPLPPALIPAV